MTGSNAHASAAGIPTTLPRTWAETRANWGAADWVALVSVPLIFLVGQGTTAIFGTGRVPLVADTLLRLILCAILVLMYRHILAEQWRRFTERLWLNLGIVVAGAILMQVVISLVRVVVPAPSTGLAKSAPLIDPMTAHGADLALMFFATLGPLAIVVIEESVFRHTLLVKMPIWGTRWLAALGIVVNGMLFGAVHFYNFGSFTGTVPYMVVGMLFNLVYLWRHNLWSVILMHLLNNFVLSTGALIAVVALRGAMG